MEQRHEFVFRAISPGANIAQLCREFGISRTLGHRLIKRYYQEGLDGIKPRSRRPNNCPHETPQEMVCEIVSIRNGHPRWGGKKIKEVLLRKHPRKEVPDSRTIDRILSRCGLSRKKRKRLRKSLPDGKLVAARRPNEVWTADFKERPVSRLRSEISGADTSWTSVRYQVLLLKILRKDFWRVSSAMGYPTISVLITVAPSPPFVAFKG